MSETQDSRAVRTFVDELRSLDDALAERGIDSQTDQRLRQRLLEPRAVTPTGRAAVWIVGLAAGAAAAILAFIVFRPATQYRSPPKTPSAAVVAGFSVDLGHVRRSHDRVRCVSSRCGLTDARLGVRVELEIGASLSRRGADLALHEGRAHFDVKPRKAGAGRFAVFVSHGRVEVLGTRFAITQRARGGSVALESGRIRFIEAGSGRVRQLVAGERLGWPLPVRKPPSDTTRPAPPSTRSVSAARPRLSPSGRVPSATQARKRRFDDLIAAVERLRAVGRYQAAASRLVAALPGVRGKRQQERLSFELGTLQGDHLSKRRAACQHFARHLRRFPGGRYLREVTSARRRWKCER